MIAIHRSKEGPIKPTKDGGGSIGIDWLPK